ncbi:MAG: YdcF family protein, partial [Verrucomicrobia bacterium]|nr:YdcF family protein [Verrucomicrobiota bacterium]
GGRGLVTASAVLFFAQIVLGIIGMPRWIPSWFSTAEVKLAEPARTIVVLGGGGIPSESGLMRTYCAAAVGADHLEAEYICMLPADGDPNRSSVGRMRDELVLRGVPRERVELESHARNTHQQAVAVRTMLGEAALGDPLLIVTSPSHARRALLCFRKAGFRQVACAVAESTGAEADMGQALFLRYGFWNALEAQVRCVRECVAMAYYKVRGWI